MGAPVVHFEINGGIAKAEGGKPFVTFYVQVEKPPEESNEVENSLFRDVLKM